MPNKYLILKGCLLVVFTTVVLLVLMAAGSGDAEGTITVDENGNAEYEKIQDAIDAAGEGNTPSGSGHSTE